MKDFSRRDFIKLGSLLAAGTLLESGGVRLFARGLERLSKTVRVVWLQGQSCSGDSVSLLNGTDPAPVDLLTKYISLVLHQTVGAAQGQTFIDVLEKLSTEKGYILAIEGSIPLGIPQACMIGHETFEKILLKLIPNASYVVAVGTCATFGGIPAAEGNPTGAVSVHQFMKHHKLPWKGKLVNCTGCPIHPKCLTGTLAYLASAGYPEVDNELLTPKMFFGRSTHDECPRYHYFERKIFAKYLGDPEGCLFQLGCLGPISYTECPHRQWNSGVNWCIRAAAPCIGCSSPYFAHKKDFPFYRKGESQHEVNYKETDRMGGVK